MIRSLRVFLASLLFLAPFALFAGDYTPKHLPRVAEEVRAKVAATFDQIQADLAIAAKDFAAAWPVESRQKRALLKLFKTNTHAVDCGFVDLGGKMTIVAPRRYRKFAEQESGTAPTPAANGGTGKTGFTPMVLPVDDFQALDFEYPVMVPGKGLVGHVSMLVRIQFLLSRFATYFAQQGVDIWIMKKDGTVVYGLTEKDRGKNIFTDERYKPFPGFMTMAEWVAGEKEGSGAYEYKPEGAQNPAHHSYAWTTLTFNGLEWRIVAVLTEQPKTLP